MKYIFKTTDQLKQEEAAQICALFNRVFCKMISTKEFYDKFQGCVFGRSYHALMMDNDVIVGCYSTIPFKYRCFGEERILALSVDTMIDNNYRGSLFNLKKLANLVYAALRQDKIPFIFGFPNDNYYLVQKYLLGWIEIGDLNLYVLPINIGAITKKLRTINVASRVYASVVNYLSGRINSYSKADSYEYGVNKIDDTEFIKYRYNDTYRIIKLSNDAYFVYKMFLEDNARVAYLIDVVPLNRMFVEGAVKYIYDHGKKEIDAIIYVGKMRACPINLCKVPKIIQPRVLHMAGKILIDSLIDDRILDINNWKVNLSNYDVR